MAFITRRTFLKTAGLGAGALFLPSLLTQCARPAPRPNILLIMADDMGYSDLGCYGGEIDTPNLNQLAADGLRFSQFYNNAKCAPTRASLLTGLYAQQVGNGQMQDCVTIAEVLRQAGYRTLMTGKWHADPLPTTRGFDRYYGMADGCSNYWNPGKPRPGEPAPVHKHFPRRYAIDGKVYQPFTPTDPDFFTTDAFTDHALAYLDQYGQENRPFFLYVAYKAPHYPLQAWPEDIAKYKGKYMKGWDALRRERHQRLIDLGLVKKEWALSPRDPRVPAWEDVENKDGWDMAALRDHTLGDLTWDSVLDREAWDLKMATYAAMVDRMDQNIGRLLDKVKSLGKEEETLVLFLSDNGGCAELVHLSPDVPPGPVNSYHTVDPPWANAQNTPFRKYKRWDQEGGISTPLIARWPGHIQAGEMTHQVGHIIDIMATCVDLAGAEYPATFQGQAIPPMEGESLAPVFRGETLAREDAIYWQYGRTKAVRQGQWKLVQVDEDPWELYDMEADRTELHDLAAQQPDRVQDMVQLYEAWATRTGAKA